MSILDQHHEDRVAQQAEAEARAEHELLVQAHRRRDPMRAVLRAEKARDDAERIARENDLDGAA